MPHSSQEYNDDNARREELMWIAGALGRDGCREIKRRYDHVVTLSDTHMVPRTWVERDDEPRAHLVPGYMFVLLFTLFVAALACYSLAAIIH